MCTSTTRLMATLAVVAGLMTAHVAFAKNNGGGGNGNHPNGNSGFKVSFRGNPQKANNFINKSNSGFKFDSHKPCYDGHCYSNYKCYSNYCYPTYGCYSYYPTCTYPVSGQVYSSPSCEPIVSTCNITVIPPVEAPRMKVALGSSLMLDGQAFGGTVGIARLRLSGTLMPIEVLEWTGSAVKIRLPQLQLAGSTIADIEVLRADGSLASKTPVELMIATEPLALGR